jgi:hypothetical protein
MWKHDPYIKEGGISAVEILHVVRDIADHLNEKDRSFFVNIGQEPQRMFEIFEPWGAVIA